MWSARHSGCQSMPPVVTDKPSGKVSYPGLTAHKGPPVATASTAYPKKHGRRQAMSPCAKAASQGGPSCPRHGSRGSFAQRALPSQAATPACGSSPGRSSGTRQVPYKVSRTQHKGDRRWRLATAHHHCLACGQAPRNADSNKPHKIRTLHYLHFWFLGWQIYGYNIGSKE